MSLILTKIKQVVDSKKGIMLILYKVFNKLRKKCSEWYTHEKVEVFSADETDKVHIRKNVFF